MFAHERISMPIPRQLGRGVTTGRGPDEKSGMVEDRSLPPLRTVTSSYDVFFPFTDDEVDDKTVRTFTTDRLDLEVKL